MLESINTAKSADVFSPKQMFLLIFLLGTTPLMLPQLKHINIYIHTYIKPMEETWYTLQYRMIICAEFANLAQNGPIHANKYMNFTFGRFVKMNN